ncbi:MAG: 23S rRNA (uracil(1939)-C(5))-methyltransferase RlmD [Muribaculaceae bacterium]
MSRKRKELPLIENFHITDVAAEGNALGRHNDMVVFVPYGAPGDVADVQLTKKKHSFAIGRITRLVEPSPERVQPVCSHFGVCGGCSWQHLPYSLQLECKRRQVIDALDRIGKVVHPEVRQTLGSERIYEYRNKMEYTFSNRSWLTPEQMQSGDVFPDRNAAGFHITGAFDKVLDIERCHLQDDLGNRIRLFVKQLGKERGYTFYDLKANTGLLRTLMIRIASTGEVMAVMQFGEDNPQAVADVMQAVRDKFPEITSLMYVINLKVNDTITDQNIILHSGRPYIEEEMEGLRFRVGPKSFYQTNSRQAFRLYETARDFASLTGSELVYDLYTGTGTIANFVARKAQRVIGIEYVPEAIEDAKINSQINGIENTEFYAGDMKDVLNDDFIAAHGRPDVMIVDPPRAGMHTDVVEVIKRCRPGRIVYVSCNPATQARDLALLSEIYDIDAVQPVDMFPHTQHVENVCRLTLRASLG